MTVDGPGNGPNRPTPSGGSTLQLTVDGSVHEVADDGATLLEVLRDRLGFKGPKDGCSPQGQCGCCTVLVDGAPRVSCVTPVRRVAGRSITTVDGLEPAVAERWADALCDSGGSQCGFCTPGIVVRLAALREKTADPTQHGPVDRALQAHLCRCTGWQTIVEAWDHLDAPVAERDLEAASRRATIEGRSPQVVGPQVALGRGGFADDHAPSDALVAVPDGAGGWVVAETIVEARRAAGKVQGRRTTATSEPPLALPDGDWVATLRTSWVEPAYLETDASWCRPGGEPAPLTANGGAFGGKHLDELPRAARELADRHGRPVRVLWSREDSVRFGPKRPPVAGGVRADGSGVIHIARTAGVADVLAKVAPNLTVVEVDVDGPPTSADLRAAGWAEAAMLATAARGRTEVVTTDDGAWAEAEVDDGRIRVRVSAGEVLDTVVLRSYAIGAAHMAFGFVTSESVTVDPSGTVHDLTIRSFGVPRSVDTPPIEVEVVEAGGPPVNGSDAVFVAVASALWLHQGCPADLPSARLAL
ncbi:MAG: 2Fe-2S iron-sulfur cluster binding domain-containing protein [Acidimicrobiales bacterium]|nr:2Fe-2S iron-sulfur cluster binding domain-containing protein [Acidimicrobiales bacterium]